MNATAVSCRDLSFAYGRELIFDKVSVDLPADAVIAVIGRSGSGKTTLLRLLAGTQPPLHGSISIYGKTPDQAKRERLIAVCPQTPSLFPWFTVRQNVEFAYRMWDLTPDAARVGWALSVVGLTDAQSKRPAQLSGGMQARVALARAWIAPGARLLLMDESFASLDEITREELGAALIRLREEERDPLTIIYVTHVIPEAIRLATQIWPLTAEKRRGVVKPIVIDEQQRSFQRNRGKSIFHESLLSLLAGTNVAQTVASKGLLEQLRERVTPEELPSLLALIRDEALPVPLRINVVQMLKPVTCGELGDEEKQRTAGAILSLWRDAGAEARSAMVFRYVEIADVQAARRAIADLLSPSSRTVFIDVIRRYLGGDALLAHVTARLFGGGSGREAQRALQVATLVAVEANETAAARSLAQRALSDSSIVVSEIAEEVDTILRERAAEPVLPMKGKE